MAGLRSASLGWRSSWFLSFTLVVFQTGQFYWSVPLVSFTGLLYWSSPVDGSVMPLNNLFHESNIYSTKAAARSRRSVLAPTHSTPTRFHPPCQTGFQTDLFWGCVTSGSYWIHNQIKVSSEFHQCVHTLARRQLTSHWMPSGAAPLGPQGGASPTAAPTIGRVCRFLVNGSG